MPTLPLNMSSPDSELLDVLVRMITPIRREFGVALDVQKFLVDRPYALEVIRTARDSTDERLRDYGAYVEGKLLGPRNATEPVATARKAPEAQVRGAAEDRVSASDLKARMLEKYKSGLR